MTQAQPAPIPLPTQSQVLCHYRVAMSQPSAHLFEVELTVTGWTASRLDLKMPVWTPGSYLVREYARHVQDFQAKAGGQVLPWQKLSKHHWQVQTGTHPTVTVSYRVFANELTVRTNHLDTTHGYFNGAALFFYIPGYQDQPIQIQIQPPEPTWQVATPLPAIDTAGYQFVAADFDTLVDSPFEVGIHQTYPFEAVGKHHAYVIWGKGNYDAAQMIADTQAIVQVEADLFGGLPYDQYLFLLHLSASGYGGLEHKTSCTLNYPRFGLKARDKYIRFMQLVAHEFFHLWNVKRIRPKALEQFDYEAENYTPSLWFSEGTTSFYDLVIPFRAGIYSAKTYLDELSKEITRFLNTPGRRVQPLQESSFDAWIKLYRPDANSPNAQISYYLKGEMVTLLLDLLIRDRTYHQRSMDDVMRQMWQHFGQPEIGFTPEQLQGVIEGVAGVDLTDFWACYLDSTADIAFDDYLHPFGLSLKPIQEEGAAPFWGGTVVTEGVATVIKFLEYAAPGQQAGLDTGDELVAIAGYRITADTLADRLRDYQPGDTVEFTVFHQDQLRTCPVTLAEPRPSRYQLVAVDEPTPKQAQAFEQWLGTPLSTIM